MTNCNIACVCMPCDCLLPTFTLKIWTLKTDTNYQGFAKLKDSVPISSLSCLAIGLPLSVAEFSHP